MLKVSLAVLLTVFVSWPALATDKVILMLNWYVYGEHAPFYYGKEKGLYSDEGIDLEIQEGRGSATVTQVVAANTVQFAYVDVPTMMRATVKGAPVIAVGVALQTNPMAAMGFAEKGILRRSSDRVIKGVVWMKKRRTTSARRGRRLSRCILKQ
jgi:NitT/TauT family transport system substrate-binding protein